MSDEIDSDRPKLTTIGVTNEILDLLKIYRAGLSAELKFNVSNRQAITHLIKTALEEKGE